MGERFMRKNLIGLVLCALLFALCVSAEAQQTAKVPRIGYLSSTGSSTPGPDIEAFRQGLRDLGYVEGKNILIEFRYLEGNSDRTPSLVAELVQLKVDILVLRSQPSIRTAKQLTTTIPIVMVTTQDPVATGFIDSLARPGANVTGVTTLQRELSGKRLELLKEAVPGIRGVALLSAGQPTDVELYKAPAHALKIKLQLLDVGPTNADFDALFRAALKGRANALVTVRGAGLTRYIDRIADLAIKNRLPSMHEGVEYVEAGGLMSYTASEAASFRRAAYYVDRILKGTKPADLPVEQPTKFEFVVNLKTAKLIGLTIPPDLLARATKILK
jgi:putative tryptophan/tyrosine transport system substrate-binding protein